jgi:hypothetical protein
MHTTLSRASSISTVPTPIHNLGRRLFPLSRKMKQINATGTLVVVALEQLVVVVV